MLKKKVKSRPNKSESLTVKRFHDLFYDNNIVLFSDGKIGEFSFTPDDSFDNWSDDAKITLLMYTKPNSRGFSKFTGKYRIIDVRDYNTSLVHHKYKTYNIELITKFGISKKNEYILDKKEHIYLNNYGRELDNTNNFNFVNKGWQQKVFGRDKIVK